MTITTTRTHPSRTSASDIVLRSSRNVVWCQGAQLQEQTITAYSPPSRQQSRQQMRRLRLKRGDMVHARTCRTLLFDNPDEFVEQYKNSCNSCSSSSKEAPGGTMAHAHLRRCRQQNVPHTNRKYQQTPTAQNRCTDAEFWTQLAMLAAEATSPVVQIRRRSPQVQHAKPQDATNARTRRTTTESEASGTKGGRHKDRQRHNHAPPAPAAQERQNRRQRERTNTHTTCHEQQQRTQPSGSTHEPRQSSTTASGAAAKTTNTNNKKEGEPRRTKQTARTHTTTRQTNRQTQTNANKRTNKRKQTQTNANKHKQTQTNTTKHKQTQTNEQTNTNKRKQTQTNNT